MKMKPPSGPKKQTQFKAKFFKRQNRLPENIATPKQWLLTKFPKKTVFPQFVQRFSSTGLMVKPSF